MRVISKEELEVFDDEQYVWYACYGSNINVERLMIYIYGDCNEVYASQSGCSNKEEPLAYNPYVFDCPIYFAGESKIWTGGMAFLDYTSKGIAYGKIYKIQMNQFKQIFEQEKRTLLYDTIIYIEQVEGLPVLTFSAHKKLECLNKPSDKYLEVIKQGLMNTFEQLTNEEIDEYLRKGIENDE